MQESDGSDVKSLQSLLSNPKVDTMVRSVAGDDTCDLIDEALSCIESSKTSEERQRAIATGIRKLESNLVSKGRDNPVLKFAQTLASLNNVKLSGK